MKKEKFLKHLKNNNCIPTGRQKGSHAQFVNIDNGKKTIVPLHSDILETTARMICKQLNIDKPKNN